MRRTHQRNVCGETRETGGVGVICIGVGCLAAGLHAANLMYAAISAGCHPFWLTCVGPLIPWMTADSQSYLIPAGQMLQRGFLHTSFLSRTPGYPSLLAIGTWGFGTPYAALWLAPLLAGGAGVAVTWITAVFTSSRWAAGAAGAVFCAWPSTYEYSPLLLTDAVHGYTAILAFAATLAWLRSHSASKGWLAVGAWTVTQSLRPTFFALPALLPVLLWRPARDTRFRRMALIMWLASWLVPIFVVASNVVHHQVATVSVYGPETLASFTVPRLKEHMGMGSFRELREAASARYDPLPLMERYRVQRQESLEFLTTHPGAALVSLLGELVAQMLEPPRYVAPHLASIFPVGMSLPGWLLVGYWLSAAVGIVLMLRLRPAIAWFLLMGFFLVMIPATVCHWVRDRLRFPVDLFAMPLAVLCWHTLSARARARFVQPAVQQ